MRIFIFIILVLQIPTSHALGKWGHQLVCELAYQQLSLPSQQQLDHLLNQLSPSDKRLINIYNRRSTSSVVTFADSCTWADAIKKDKDYVHFNSWHYLNVGRGQQQTAKDDCRADCVTSAITTHLNQYRFTQQPQEKLQALMFLGHWVGDIHQPFHVSFASDRGGNQVKLKLTEVKCNNLHWLWDECLISYPNLSYKALLEKLTTELTTAPISSWQKSTINDWANESLAIVRLQSVGYCQLTEQHCQPLKSAAIKNFADYATQYQPVLHTRIMQAAVRLAELLETN